MRAGDRKTAERIWGMLSVTMNSTKSAPASVRRSRPAPAKKTVRQRSASSQATEEARKGDPLPVRNPRDRSPKQENL